MIICPKCSFDNPLGRVFCGKCGGKLDFTHTSSQEMASKNVQKNTGKYVKNIITGVIVVVLVFVALIFWPQTALLGKAGIPGGEKRVQSGVKAVAAVKKGQSVILPVKEEDLNAYLDQIKAKEMGMDSMSVSLQQEFFNIRMIKTVFDTKKTIKETPVALRLSYDLSCAPIPGGKLMIGKAKIGHLPLPGPLKKIAANAILNKMVADKDWPPFKNVTEIKSEVGRLTVTIKP